MIKHKTVLILGAGASKPYGMPLGRELRDDVIRGVAEKSVLGIVLNRFSISPGHYAAFTENLAESGYQSVDAFLEDRAEWMDIGKAAISLSLLKAEGESKDKLFPPNQPRDHWYEVLWQKLRAPSWSTFKSNPWNVITFNYDRTLEHYLVKVLCNNYSVKPETVSKALPIIHVHGSLGAYISSEFGKTVTPEMHKLSARSIRVVHEVNRSPEFVHARNIIRQAERIVFVGFAYHMQNMKKLRWHERNLALLKRQIVVGTHKGIKVGDWAYMCSQNRFSWRALKSGGGTISELLKEILN